MHQRKKQYFYRFKFIILRFRFWQVSQSFDYQWNNPLNYAVQFDRLYTDTKGHQQVEGNKSKMACSICPALMNNDTPNIYNCKYSLVEWNKILYTSVLYKNMHLFIYFSFFLFYMYLKYCYEHNFFLLLLL